MHEGYGGGGGWGWGWGKVWYDQEFFSSQIMKNKADTFSGQKALRDIELIEHDLLFLQNFFC